jgi:hypothetical protein
VLTSLAMVSDLAKLTLYKIWSSSFAVLGVAAGCVILISSCGGSDAAAGISQTTNQPGVDRPTPAAAALSQSFAMSGAPATVAARAADRLIGSVRLAGVSRLQKREPAGARGRLGGAVPGPGLVNVVSRTRFSETHLRPLVVLAEAAERLAPAGKLESRGYGGDHGVTTYWSETISFKPASPKLRAVELRFAVAPAGRRSYALRVEALAAWRPVRPSSSLIPAAASSLSVTVAPVADFAAHATPPMQVSHNRRTVQTVAAVVNAQFAGQLENNINCPAETSNLMLWLQFVAADGRQLALVEVSPYQCGNGTWITTPRGPRTIIEGGDHIIAAVEHDLHIHLPPPFS